MKKGVTAPVARAADAEPSFDTINVSNYREKYTTESSSCWTLSEGPGRHVPVFQTRSPPTVVSSIFLHFFITAGLSESSHIGKALGAALPTKSLRARKN